MILFFESRAVEQIIKNDNRDCVLITNESGSGDEAFVEIRDGYLLKCQKMYTNLIRLMEK